MRINPTTLTELQQVTDSPVVIADNRGLITYVNSCFQEVLGWTQQDLLGKLITTLLPEEFRDSHNLAFSRFQFTEKATVLNHPLKLKTITKDRQEIITEHYIIAEKTADGWAFGAILKPLT